MQNLNYRSKLVERQLKAQDHSGTSYFAPAPPLALRTVVGLAVTHDLCRRLGAER